MADFSLLLLPGSHAAGVAVSLDLLAAAARLAPDLGLAAPRWRVLAPQGGTLELSSGLRLETQALPTRADRSLWVLPGLGLDSPDRLHSGLVQPDAQRSRPRPWRAMRRRAGIAPPAVRRCSCCSAPACWRGAVSPPVGGWRPCCSNGQPEAQVH